MEAGRAIEARTSGRGDGDGERSSSAGSDFGRLERAIEFLIGEHERLTREKDELLRELTEREQRVASLESQVARERERREVAIEGVDKILGRLEQLQSSVAVAAEAQ